MPDTVITHPCPGALESRGSKGSAARNCRRGLAALVLCFIVSAAVSCGGGSSDSKPAAAETQSAFSPLIGRWLRPDGGYVLAINGVEQDGTASAAYYNPNPIRVSRARASSSNGKLELFVELLDTGYPGCTYTLAYEKAEDRLAGVYYQAAQQQSYDIFFVREK